MERRSFLTNSVFSAVGMSALATMLGSKTAKASMFTDMNIEIPGVEISDDEDSYKNWAVSPSTPNGEIRFKVLWKSTEPGNEGICRIFRLKKGAKIPRHFHPEGELTCVLAGSFIQERESKRSADRYSKGDVIWMPAKSIHGAAMAENDGTTVLVFTPKNILFKF